MRFASYWRLWGYRSHCMLWPHHSPRCYLGCKPHWPLRCCFFLFVLMIPCNLFYNIYFIYLAALGLSCDTSDLHCGTQASQVSAHGIICPAACEILVPRAGIKPTYSTLEGGFLTTGPPGKSLHCFLNMPAAIWLIPAWNPLSLKLTWFTTSLGSASVLGPSVISFEKTFLTTQFEIATPTHHLHLSTLLY